MCQDMGDLGPGPGSLRLWETPPPSDLGLTKLTGIDIHELKILLCTFKYYQGWEIDGSHIQPMSHI